AATFSPDGSTLVIALGRWHTWWGDESEIQFWDARTGAFLYYLTGHWSAGNNIRDIHVAISRDGHTIVSAGSYDSTVRLWDARTGELLGRPETFATSVSSMAFSPDGSTLVWAEGGRIRSWEARTGVFRYPDFGGHSSSVDSIAFSPDGATLASGSSNTSIGLWDVRARENKRLFFAHKGGVTSVAFSPDGLTLASGGRDKTVRLWDARTGEHIRALSSQMDEIVTVAFSHDGKLLASCSSGRWPFSGSDDNTIRIWDARTGDHLHSLEGHTDGVSSVSFHPGVPILASGSYDNTIRIWDARTGKNIHTLEGHMNAVTSLAFSSDGNTLVSGSWDSTILLWEFRRFTTWGDIKYTAADGIMHTPKLLPPPTNLTPLESALLPNYPNPFNPETWIPYQLKKPADVTLAIYDLKGRAVRSLTVGHQPAGMYQNTHSAAYWDGRNELGEPVANGVYFYTLSAGDFTATRKMLVGN
ncbi:MAG: T9SS type A sorting domain-containing protein, partial [Candidatus Poribacteria bacterium]|nr:T9SS type A sorting domain-containing protein [Candidatus Poribacteria bacterium]